MILTSADAPAVALVRAIRGGDVAALRAQLDASPGLAAARLVDERGVARTLLHVVADWPGHVPRGAELVAVLVQAGAAVNAPVEHAGATGSPETALHWAASSDDVAVLDALLDHGADIEAPGAVFTGGTPMSDAVVFAQWRAARRLLARGAVTTLWQAAALGVLDRVQAHCAAQPAPTAAECDNALWHACRGGDLAVVAYLVDHGANPHAMGHDRQTALEAAAAAGHDAVVTWLRATPR